MHNALAYDMREKPPRTSALPARIFPRAPGFVAHPYAVARPSQEGWTGVRCAGLGNPPGARALTESDKRSLELNPLSRLFRGDDNDADRLGDFLTDSSFLAGRLDTQLNLALLAQIDRSKLSETDKLAYDVFKPFYVQNSVVIPSQ